MIPVLFLSTATDFTNYGVGALSDAISCEVEEERNGSYELTLQYPITGIHFSDISLRSIILAKPNYLDDPQPFRVYQIDKPINGKCTIYARHWSYDLSDIPVQPFTASGIQSAMNGLKSNAMFDLSAWTFTTSRTTASNFKVDEPSSVRSWFGGKAGSLLDVYGGEWHYTGRTCSLENSRGEDRGVTIRYGVNLTDLKQEENCADVYTGVLAYWKDMDGNLVQGTVQNVSGTFDYTKIYILDCSEDYEEAPTVAQLNARATNYIANNDVGIPDVNLKLNFVTLAKDSTISLLADIDGAILATDDGQMLVANDGSIMGEGRVDLCDTVTIYFEKLGVSAKAKCIRVRWNTLLDRYEEIELGDAKSDLTEAIIRANTTASEAVKQVYLTKNVVESDIEEAVQKISGNLGGYVIFHDTNDDGYPDELLIMDTDDITTATNVWRWNQQGLMHANSYTGTYANAAITMDGKIVADAITTGTLRGIEIISTDGTNTVDIVNGKITTTGTSGTSIGKTETTCNYYKVQTSDGTEVALLYIGGYTTDGVFTPSGGSLKLSDENGNRGASMYVDSAGSGTLMLYDTQGNNGVYASANTFGRLDLFNNGNLYIHNSSNVVARMTATDAQGGSAAFNWADGTSKIYLGTLTLAGLMQNEPALAFYDTSGNITSWYCGNRAYIKDPVGEEGYVVHGHTSAHGICVDYSTIGQVDFYADATYIGYITLTSSDERTKTDIHSIEKKYKKAVASVDLKNFHFDFQNEVLSGANALLRFGAIAQDVIKALENEGIDPKDSELVNTVGDNDGERYVINYIPFLTARLAADEDRIKILEERIEALEARIGV